MPIPASIAAILHHFSRFGNMLPKGAIPTLLSAPPASTGNILPVYRGVGAIR